MGIIYVNTIMFQTHLVIRAPSVGEKETNITYKTVVFT